MSGPVRITMNRFNAWIDGLFPPAITEGLISPEVQALRAEVERLKAAHAAFAASRTAYLESLDRKIGVCRASLATAVDRIVAMDVAATAAEHKAAALQRANDQLSATLTKITADAVDVKVSAAKTFASSLEAKAAATAAEQRAELQHRGTFARLLRDNAQLSATLTKITADARQRADRRNLTARLRTAKAKATPDAFSKPRKRAAPSA